MCIKNKLYYTIQSIASMIFNLCIFSGPCGGKTTGQARLSTFFEGLGWKVSYLQQLLTYYTVACELSRDNVTIGLDS